MISLQFITHHTEKYSYLDSARMALEGGCKWIQLRMKEAPLEEVEAVALQLKPMCKEHDAILILDDHVELAQKLEVDGVHLGKTDMPVAEARQLLGEAFIIGGTANTFEDVEMHYRAGADYVGIGPFHYYQKEPESCLGNRRIHFHHFTDATGRNTTSGSSHRRYHLSGYSGYHENRSQRYCFIRYHTAGRKPCRRDHPDLVNPPLISLPIINHHS